jgi:hypothetical protein
MTFEKAQLLVPRIILDVPTLPAKITFDVPIRLWVIKKHSKLAAANGAKIHFFVVACVFFLEAHLAH